MQKKPRGKKPKPDPVEIVHTSCYIPEDSYVQLQHIAITQKKRVHDLILDGLDKVLARHGKPPITRRPKGGSSKKG